MLSCCGPPSAELATAEMMRGAACAACVPAPARTAAANAHAMIRFFTDESPSRDEGISCEGGETIKETSLRVRNSPYSGITMTRIRTRYPRTVEFHPPDESCARFVTHPLGMGLSGKRVLSLHL